MAEALWLDQITEADRARVGQKALVLARLLRQGLPVPDGFVLPAGTDLDAAQQDTLFAAYARLGGAVAVRSSGTAEDLQGASFAGQYRTILDVRQASGVVAAARACLASASQASGYARALSAPETGAMAVLVQRFVEPRAAGVAFTRHPMDPDAMLVESHAGRGEALVSGEVTPDRYVLDRASGAVREGPANGSLDAMSLAQIAALARHTEVLLGAPQDVEWAIGTDGPVLLQARPITVESEQAPDPPARRLSRANVGEVLPDPITPLTWSTVCAFLEDGFRDVARQAGLLPEAPGALFVLYRRRLYMNLDLCLESARRLPGISVEAAERLVFGSGSASGSRVSVSAAALPGLARVACRTLWMNGRLGRDIEAAAHIVNRLPEREVVEASDQAGLARMLSEFLEAGRRVGATHIATTGGSAVRLALLSQALGRWVEGDAADLSNRLVAGLPDVTSTAPTLALEAIAAEARARSDWSSWLAKDPEAAALAYARREVPPDLRAWIEKLLCSYGHRAVSEGELAARTWRDDPAPLFAALKSLLASPRPPGFGHRARVESRLADEEALLARLGPLRRPVIARLLAGAMEWIRQRERTKSIAIALVAHGRSLAHAAAARLVAAGALGNANDVFFLQAPELLAALDGQPVPPALIERRKRRHEREAALPAPRDVDFSAPEGVPGAHDGDSLAGIGVSPGSAMGRARVLQPGRRIEFLPGEILVAPVLDAGLGPFLASAAGAVAEIGGMLSHGSVVARELGVPCVVDVRDATSRIRTGDLLLVDGTSGKLRLPASDTDLPALEVPAGPTVAEAPIEEGLHELAAHPLARESVYFNALDAKAGIAIVASIGRRSGGRGESLLAIALPDGRVLFALNREAADCRSGRLAVGPGSTSWQPVTLSYKGAIAEHAAAGFPPAPLPLLLAPATLPIVLDLAFTPVTPAIDFCEGLPEDMLRVLEPMGRHHIEQSGVWRGELVIDGRRIPLEAKGSRDHSWGLRDWNAADHWRLFTLQLGDDLAVHALVASIRGVLLQGGFVWREGRAERVTRIEYAAQRRNGALDTLELEVTAGVEPPLELRGTVLRRITVPVQVSGRPWRHLAGRPYPFLLHEHYVRYECCGRTGQGVAEFTERRG